jgi:mucin-19
MASGADAIILVDRTGTDTIDVASALQGSGTTLTLDAGQRLYSFNAGDTINIGGGAPANFLLTGIQAGAVTNPFAGTGAPVLTTAAGGANTVSLANGNLLQGVVISNGPGGFAAAGSGIAGLTISGSGLGGLSLTNATGTATVTDTTLTHLAISGGSINFTGNNADVTTGSNVAAVSVSGSHSGTVTFDALSSILATAGAGLQFDNADGTYSFNGPTTLNGGDAGIDILNGSAGFFTFGTGTSITSPSGAAFTIANSTAGVTYSGTITQNNAASAVVATNNTGGTATFGGLVVANTGTADAVSLTGNTGATISFNSGLDIDTTSGAGFTATGGGTAIVVGAGNSIATTTGTALNLAGITVGAGGLNFANVSVNGAANGITLANTASTGGSSISLGTVSLQNVTSRGVDISGTSGAAVSFADLDISLNNTAAVAFDLNVATINAAVTANDFDVTNNAAAGTTIGVDLRGAVGGSVVRLGDTAAGGASSSIAGVNTGVFLNSATNLAFVYGDGESATDQLSTISANVGIDASSAPVAGSYNFLDVNFQTSPGLGFGVGKIYFVGATATGDGSGRDQNNLATIATAEAVSVVGDVLVLVNNGGVITAAGTNADNTLVLSDGEQVRGFGNGNINLALTPPSTIQLANTSISILDATPDGAATLTSSAGADTITLGSQNNIIDGFILDGDPAGAARGIIDNGAGASNTVVSHMTIQNFDTVGVEVTPSSGTTIDSVAFSGNASDLLVNAANTTITNVSSTGATGTAFQILNATGTTTLTNVSISGAGAGGIVFSNAAGTVNATNVDISGAAPLAITGGTAAFTFDVNSSITTSSGAAVSVSGGHATGTFTFAGSILGTGGSGIAFDNADGTYNFTGDVDLSNTSNGIAVLNGSAGSFSFSNAGSTITDPTGIAILIDGGAGGFSYAGAVSKTTNGQAVSIANKTGGTVNLAGDISSTGSSDGIALTNNTGATINFAGALTLNTSASNTTAFSATGGGTVTATGAGSAINSGTAIALNLSGVTVGAPGMVFGSTNKAAGGTNAVILSSVTGTGTINLGGGALGGGSGPTIRIGDGAGGANTGGTAGLTYSGSIGSSTAGRTIDIEDRAAGAQNITLSGNITHNVAGQTGIFLDDNAAGTITFSGTSKSITSGTAIAVSATDNTGATISFLNGGLDIDTTTATGFTATGGGTFNVAGAGNSITTTTGQIVNWDGVSVGASGVSFASLASTGTVAADAISLSNVDGAGTFNGGAVTVNSTSGAGSDGIAITGGSAANFSFSSATIDNTGGNGINLDGANGAVTFATVDIDGTTGAGVFVNANTNAVNISGGTIGATNDPTGIGVDINGGNGNVTVAASVAKTTAGDIVEVTGRTGGTVTFSGNLSATGGVANGIDVNGNTGGTINFSGTTKTLTTGANTAVNLATNSGATINFTGGGLVINTTSGIGFNATGGGTVTVQGTGNTITSTTGTALNIANTTIGGADVTFQAISANGAVSGIILNNTGASGGLTVTGDGSVVQGGNASGGIIQNTTSNGISLTNTRDVSLNNMRIQDSGDSGIEGTQVTNFAFTNGNIVGAGNGSDESSISFDVLNANNVSGVLTVTNSTLTNSDAHGIDVENYSGTLSDVVISNNILTGDGPGPVPGGAVKIIARGSATAAANVTKATLTNNNISNFDEHGFLLQGGNVTDVAGAPAGTFGVFGSATDIITVTGNLMDGGNLGIGSQPDRFITAGVAGRGQMNLNISNNGTAANPIRNIDGVVIEVQADGNTDLSATISNNRIVANNAVGSAGIAVGADADSATTTTDDAHVVVTISGNNISATDGPGIFALARGTSTASMDVHILNNTVAAPVATNAARAGIRVDSGSATSINTTINLEISGNTTAGSTNTATATTSPGINLRKQGTDPTVNTFNIKGMPEGVTASPGVENYVNSINNSTSGTFGVGGTALLSATSGFTNDTPVGFLQAAPAGVEAIGEDIWGEVLTGDTLDSIVAVAIDRWAATGLTDEQLAVLNSATFEIADLGGSYLGLEDGSHIRIDDDGAGYGWYVDATPLTDEEFANRTGETQLIADGTQAPAGQYDLLTTIMHEFGHMMGYGDTYAADQSSTLMYGWLQTGERRLPVMYTPQGEYYEASISE